VTDFDARLLVHDSIRITKDDGRRAYSRGIRMSKNRAAPLSAGGNHSDEPLDQSMITPAAPSSSGRLVLVAERRVGITSAPRLNQRRRQRETGDTIPLQHCRRRRADRTTPASRRTMMTLRVTGKFCCQSRFIY